MSEDTLQEHSDTALQIALTSSELTADVRWMRSHDGLAGGDGCTGRASPIHRYRDTLMAHACVDMHPDKAVFCGSSV